MKQVTGRDFAKAVQRHVAVDHRAEEWAPVRHAQRHEVHPAPGIVMPAQPDRATVVYRRIVTRLPASPHIMHHPSPCIGELRLGAMASVLAQPHPTRNFHFQG